MSAVQQPQNLNLAHWALHAPLYKLSEALCFTVALDLLTGAPGHSSVVKRGVASHVPNLAWSVLLDSQRAHQ